MPLLHTHQHKIVEHDRRRKERKLGIPAAKDAEHARLRAYTHGFWQDTKKRSWLYRFFSGKK